jgi:hypothetical protein
VATIHPIHHFVRLRVCRTLLILEVARRMCANSRIPSRGTPGRWEENAKYHTCQV